MGGEKIMSCLSTAEEEQETISSVDDFEFISPIGRGTTDCNNLSIKRDEGKGLVFGETGQGSADQYRSGSWVSQVDHQKREAAFREVLQSYDQLLARMDSLTEAKKKILSYTPGAWIENVGDMALSDSDVPKMTSLVLIGLKGSGKSSLVNRISKVFEDDKFASERAQVTYNSSVGDGTYFVQEYAIPRGSKSFALYDTRSLSDDIYDNVKTIKQWITEGVRHGELVIRTTDSLSLRNRMKCKAREIGCESMVRKVNFVIFVVDGLAVLKSMETRGNEEKQYNQILATTFNCPYLSFRDDKPVVVVTHGDLLSLRDRARVRTHLGELLSIPPTKQIFDIPESSDPENELTIVDMLRYCLEHADRNLSRRTYVKNKGLIVSVLTIHLLLILGVAFTAFSVIHPHNCHAPKSNSHVEWRHIRHMWLG